MAHFHRLSVYLVRLAGDICAGHDLHEEMQERYGEQGHQRRVWAA